MAPEPTPVERRDAKALIAELRKGDYTLRRSDADQKAFDSSWEVRIVAAFRHQRAGATRALLTDILNLVERGEVRAVDLVRGPDGVWS